MPTAQEILHDIIFDVVLKAVLARLVAAVPFLGFPLVYPLVALALGKLAGMFYDELALVVEYKLIDNKVGEEKDNYVAAVEQLKVVLEKPISETTKQELEDAKIELQARLRALANFKPPK